MSRAFRRKKKSFQNSIERKSSDSAMDKNPYIQNTYLRWGRILGKIPHRTDYPLTEYRKRLAGGADKDVVGGNTTASQSVVDELVPSTSTAQVGQPATYERRAPSYNRSKAASEKNVDEMIDCAIKNLQEAGKALVALGENHEHELKLMVMDVLAKFQKWIDVLQRKMDTAKYDINNIRKVHAAQMIAMASKDREIESLRAQLAQCEAEKAVFETAHAENQCSIIGGQNIPENATGTQLTTPVLATVPLDKSSHHPPSQAIVQPVADGNQRGVAIEQLTSVANDVPVTDTERAASHHTAISFSAPVREVQNGSGDKETSGNAMSSWVAIARKLSRSQIHVPSSPGRIPSSSQVGAQSSELPANSIRALAPTDTLQHTSGGSQAPIVTIQQYPATSANPPVTNAGTMTGDNAITSAPPRDFIEVPSTAGREDDQEQAGRVVELEAELMQLRSENERIKKDHAEYENSIQRALLQGVSSLNAEALKVLKNPPFICYKPCEPCNPSLSPSRSDITENVPCILQVPKNNMSRRCGRNFPSNAGTMRHIQEDRAHSLSRKQAASVCYAPAKKSSQNSMLFLLPQQHIDCPCAAVLQEHYVGSNYDRIRRQYPGERLYCSTRFLPGRHGLRGGFMKTHTRTCEQCEPPCNRNRKFIAA